MMDFARKIKEIGAYLNTHPLWEAILSWAKNHSLPGLKRIPIYNILLFIGQELRKEALVTRANSMAFSFFLAIFPSIIFLITLLPYLPFGDNFFSTMEVSITQVLPGTAGDWVFKTITDLLKHQRANLLSFGFVLALWFSSNGVMSMMNGLRKNYEEAFIRRSFFKQRLLAIQLTILLAFSLFLSIVLVILGNTILNFVFHYIKADWLTKMSFFALRWVAILLLFYCAISIMYRYGSTLRKRIPFINAGATLATILCIGASWGFSFYVDNFSQYNTIYGSIGTIIALMLWIQINCMVILIGFELNASIAVIAAQRKNKSSEALADGI